LTVLPEAIVIETDRLRLRAPVPGDWEAARAFFMSDRAKTIGGPNTLGRSWRIFAELIGHWTLRGFGMWVVTARGEDRALGMVGPFFPGDWPEAEIGWMIWDDACEGQGIAYEAARAARADALTRLGWTTAVSYVAPTNYRSIRLAERLGARHDPCAAFPPGKDACLVYRHPAMEDLA
jgi:RimJ/RimL family protein N-acetyltransferase